MRKISALLLVCALAISLCACSGTGKDTAKENLPNPVKEATADEVLTQTGIRFQAPEGAEAVSYGTIEQSGASPIAQMQFTLNGIGSTYRVWKTEAPSGTLPDISGLYEVWTGNAEASVGDNEAQLHWIEGKQGYIAWYDNMFGRLYCLSVDSGAGQEGLISLAETLYSAGQGRDSDFSASELAGLLYHVSDRYDPGSAGCSLRAAKLAGQILDWYVSSGTDQETVTDVTARFGASLDREAWSEIRAKMDDIQNGAVDAAGNNGLELLDTAGYTPSCYPWASKDVDAVFSAIGSGLDKAASLRSGVALFPGTLSELGEQDTLDLLTPYISMLNSCAAEKFGVTADLQDPYIAIFASESAWKNNPDAPEALVRETDKSKYKDGYADPAAISYYKVKGFTSNEEVQQYLNSWLGESVVEKWFHNDFFEYDGALYLARGGRGYGSEACGDTALQSSPGSNTPSVTVTWYLFGEQNQKERLDFHYQNGVLLLDGEQAAN